MIIKNFEDLATSKRRRDALEILEAGLEAASPQRAVARHVTPDGIAAGRDIIKFADYAHVYSVAFGKAADAMTRALNSIFSVERGLVVIPKGSRSVIRGKKFQIFNSRHPVPDRESARAAREVLKFVRNRREGELVVFLISGGASSLMALPDGITLDEKIRVTDLMLRSGATIQELNCVRKHLSGIKGGRLVRDMRCHGVGLAMSDVEGDDLASIASGPTHPDDTTYADALDVIGRHGLARKMPAEVMDMLEARAQGPQPEPGPGIANLVIATNADCLDAMRRAARKKRYRTSVMQVFGGIKDAVPKILGNVPDGQGACLIFGGETTVKVLGRGTGGRNQELVLRLLKNAQGSEKMVIASAGTDGIDGNSRFAGAITENVRSDPDTIKEFLRNSDSGRFFEKRGSNILTGFTHTNLMDIGLILR